MKPNIIQVPSIKEPIRPSPGFAKKGLSDFKLDACCRQARNGVGVGVTNPPSSAVAHPNMNARWGIRCSARKRLRSR